MTDLRHKHLHLDCFAGIAGDMFLGAVLDLGVPEVLIREGLATLPLEGYTLEIGRTRRLSIEGCDVKVRVDGEHHHPPAGAGDDHHRAWTSIEQMIEDSILARGVKDRALDIFGRVARAEARLHGVDLGSVSFHEVGAVDSIVDIVGAALALDYLAPARVTSRPVPLGHGKVHCAHGALPVPAPASVEILRGASVEDGGAGMELCTPTGAAIVASIAESYGPIPAGTLVAAGYGAGDDVLEDRPNLLRLLLLEAEPRDEAEANAVVVEANVDNMSPELCGHLLERLFSAGARDVWYTPITMKKGRPALTISTLCARSKLGPVGQALLAESTTIGMRHYPVSRRTLSRENVQVQTPYGPVQVKVARDGEQVMNVSPEFELCKAAADRCGVPLKEVYAAAMDAYRRS